MWVHRTRGLAPLLDQAAHYAHISSIESAFSHTFFDGLRLVLGMTNNQMTSCEAQDRFKKRWALKAGKKRLNTDHVISYTAIPTYPS
jgi:hypothetical protein